METRIEKNGPPRSAGLTQEGVRVGYNGDVSSERMRVTVMGSGTSMGVPTLGCHCTVCESADPHDKRLRPSLLLSRGERNVVIDTTPDFRTQALRAGIDRLDAVILTHGHADHILGFDDLRPFNFKQRAAMPVYGSDETFRIVRRAFAYVFDEKPSLSSVPSVKLHLVKGPFELMGVQFVPVPLVHGEMEVLGFRFGRAAYLTDFSRLPDSSAALLEGLDDLILDALRDVPHPMHMTVEQSLALIDRLKPKRAWFTHIAHELPHAATNERLRKAGYPQVQLAYDGLTFEVETEARAVEVRAAGVLRVFGSGEEWAHAFGDGRKDLTQRTQRRNTEHTEKNGPSFATKSAASAGGSVIAIGNFDGIHLGHQRVLEFCIGLAKESGAVATALTFEPPPLKVLRPESAPLRISTNAQRLEWFAALGMEAAVVLPFTKELSQLAPDEFVEEILVRQMNVLAVVVGDNFRFGHKQAGDVKFLRELGMRDGFDVIVHEPVVVDGEIVSSTAIRKLIAGGDVTRAARMLGRAFALTGEVVAGTGTGRKFTFPTMNLRAEQELLPARGVYITRTVMEGEPSSHRSVTNVGMRPTFNGTGLTVETHLLEYSGNFSPKRIEVRFWKKLREEKKFAGAEELKAQIAKDIARANGFFARLRRMRGKRLAGTRD
ncbi:MAG TPA: bifunctional riboflavin kinase/FAD synthetase [Candidatus Limnocylindrales bacterium]|nr:bifunctional riboflavin kinase/FAD synthetase [Candidatus Limnocylindrales bacterium]